jgi:hypothetical protein
MHYAVRPDFDIRSRGGGLVFPEKLRSVGTVKVRTHLAG